ncbi:hypothetical protein HY374_01390 [Candidatus Berkelbacteria bacterium]|nr:hypothetical protein [Candidatus Berkelbacteria bacterium]
MKRDAGFGLLEVVISAGILATVVTASVGLMNQSLKRAVLASERTTAMNLASEALEQVRMLRDSTYVDQKIVNGQVNQWFDWTATGDPAATTTYHVDLTQRMLVPGEETITLDGRAYVRKITVTLPDESDDTSYAQTAGLTGVTDTAVIRKVTATVTWGDGPAQSVESITYLTDWRSGV